ncbi:MAG: DinB family protein [Planctomycetota bacterium]
MSIDATACVHAKEIRVLRFMQGYSDDLVKDIAPADFCTQPVAGMNHPAWIIGHLAYASDGHSAEVGGTPELTHFADRYGFGSEVSGDASLYGSKDGLIELWHAANARYIAAMESATAEQLGKPTRGPLFEAFPTVGEFLSFSLTGHVSLHLGQLSAWRRAMGMPRLF